MPEMTALMEEGRGEKQHQGESRWCHTDIVARATERTGVRYVKNYIRAKTVAAYISEISALKRACKRANSVGAM